MRALLVAGFIIVVLGLLAALWSVGGLEKAPDEPSTPVGKPIKNKLLTITPRSAAIAPPTGTTPKPTLRIKADLVVHGKEPVDFYMVDDVLAPKVDPGGELKHMKVALDRNPDGFYSFMQPGVREEVVLSWELPKKVKDPGAIASVDFTVLEAEFSPGFWDERSTWKSTDKDVGQVAIPIGEE